MTRAHAGGALEKLPLAAMGAIPIVGLLLVMCRIGIYKYGAANRNYGYELHLARTKDMPTGGQPGVWKPSWRLIEWEEALRAWRIVHPAVFRALYRTPESGRLSGRLLRVPGFRFLTAFLGQYYRPSKEARRVIDEYKRAPASERANRYPWFMVKLLAVPRDGEQITSRASLYYAGSYLKRTMSTLVLAQWGALGPLFLVIVREWTDRPRIARVCLVTLVALVYVIVVLGRHIKRRREILEDELLSIHSCAITWQVVVTAHYRAKEELGDRYAHYTEALVRHAVDAGLNAFEPHAWVERGARA